jgi:hypothetical protein
MDIGAISSRADSAGAHIQASGSGLCGLDRDRRWACETVEQGIARDDGGCADEEATTCHASDTRTPAEKSENIFSQSRHDTKRSLSRLGL